VCPLHNLMFFVSLRSPSFRSALSGIKGRQLRATGSEVNAALKLEALLKELGGTEEEREEEEPTKSRLRALLETLVA
jgi:hypothetical protein